MYAHFHGIVSEKTPNSVVLECGGVGYLLTVSAQTLFNVPPVGDTCKLFSTLVVREDAMELFGFATREEREAFERLRSVSGVGAKMALSVLSTLSAQALAIAVAANDANALTRVPGVGKKTAQRLILELKDKVSDDMLTQGSGKIAVPSENSAQGEAIEALMALGYPASEAARMVSKTTAAKVDEIVMQALRGRSE